MFFDLDIRGDALPPRTLCLTYDDGPGPRTSEIGAFLAARGIAAAFFFIGAHARSFPEVAPRLRSLGHVVGNHTDTHPVLVPFARDGGDAVGELTRAEAAIAADRPTDPVFFRPPYGDWREDGATTSPLAGPLNASGRLPTTVGPIGWDIDRADWRFWLDRRAAEDCGLAYLEAIEAAGRGIVLMHDGSESAEIRDHNRTFEMTCWLVPILEARGYRFARLDEVPAVASATRVDRQVAFRAESGRFATLPPGPAARLACGAKDIGGRETFGIIPLGRGKFALRAWDGGYLGPTAGGEVVARSGEPQAWTIEPAAGGRLLLRAEDGRAWGLGDEVAGEFTLRDGRASPFEIRPAFDEGRPAGPEVGSDVGG